MAEAVFSLPALLWQVFNVLVLIGVFAFLGWRVLQVAQRRMRTRAADKARRGSVPQ